MIAHAHIVSMQRVDHVKIPPHKPIAPVHFAESALGDARPRIKFAARFQTVALQKVGLHPARLKWNSIVAVVRVKPPTLVKQTALFLEAIVKRRAWKRREMIERRNI